MTMYNNKELNESEHNEAYLKEKHIHKQTYNVDFILF
jgi:hypothetical protein